MAQEEGNPVYHVCAFLSCVIFSADYGAIDRSTCKAPRMLEYLALESLPDLTDAEVAEIDQTGGKEHHRYYVSIAMVLSSKTRLRTASQADWMDSDSQL